MKEGNLKWLVLKGKKQNIFFNDQELNFRDWVMKAFTVARMVTGLTKDNMINPPGADCSTTYFTTSVVGENVEIHGTGGCKLRSQ